MPTTLLNPTTPEIIPVINNDVTKTNAYKTVGTINSWADLMDKMTSNPCVKTAITKIYVDDLANVTNGATSDSAKASNIVFAQKILGGTNISDANLRTMAQVVWKKLGPLQIDSILTICESTPPVPVNPAKNKSQGDPQTGYTSGPFDMRLSRFEISSETNKGAAMNLTMPYNVNYSDITTSGYIIGKTEVDKLAASAESEKIRIIREFQYNQMATDNFFKGVPALQNYYAIVRLYGTDGGKYLVNQKGQRRWYEVDQTLDSNGANANFASIPTTSALISWGQGDPNGRTPYQFTDFVFAKYWKKIENNRLITLRRFAAPILDNLKFPGMGGATDKGTAGGKADSGSNYHISFPPMATAITYFGGETGNNLNSILKFTTGVPWEDVQASVWEVNAATTPDSKAGPGKLYGELTRFAEMLNVAGGNFDRDLIMNQGALPPDPYNNGPYENRIMGPIDRIDSVKKRKAGMTFAWEGLNLVFEYVARPVGGVNPKAALLDIMSNFLVMGSASAVFFGGAHRFMADPATHPFLGGERGIQKWYAGKPIEWGTIALEDLTKKAQVAGSGTWENAKAFFGALMGGEGGAKLFGGTDSLFSSGATKNIINEAIAKKTAGQVPYLQGMRAILTGEPIGEWHITIGNPLNPIAMIGNLICEGIDVEFNDELGPDDFPTEIKITVKLKHAMARDRDAIESIFNRGMGRIYNLPDGFLGSSDYQTRVDRATQVRTQTGTTPNPRLAIIATQADTGRTLVGANGITNTLGGSVSVWNRGKFDVGLSENYNTNDPQNWDIFRSAYRTANWIAMRSI